MKHIVKALVSILSATVLIACDKTGDDSQALDPNLTKDLTFSLSIVEIDGGDVSISVRNNGTTNDSWYGFATTDLTTDINILIKETVAELKAEGNIPVKKNTKLTVGLKDLMSFTEYRYIVFGVTASGQTYGTPSSIGFETLKSAGVFEKTDDWSIVYNGRIQDDYGNDMEAFTITPNTGKRYYFTTLSTYYLEFYELNDILASEAAYIESFFEAGYGLDDLTCTTKEVLGNKRLESGDYLALAMGFDDNGKATGYYSSMEFTIEEEEATAAYNAWLGTWKVTASNNGADGNPIVYNISIEHGDNNFFYYVRHWEVGDQYDNDPFGEDYNFDVFQFPAYFQDEDGSFIVESLDFTDVNYDQNYGYFGLFGSTTYEGNFQYVCVTGDRIAKGTLTDSSNGTMTGMKSGLDLDFTYEGMGFTGYYEINGGENYNAFSFNTHAKFPITMEKTGGASQQSLRVPASGPAPSLKKTDIPDIIRIR